MRGVLPAAHTARCAPPQPSSRGQALRQAHLAAAAAGARLRLLQTRPGSGRRRRPAAPAPPQPPAPRSWAPLAAGQGRQAKGRRARRAVGAPRQAVEKPAGRRPAAGRLLPCKGSLASPPHHQLLVPAVQHQILRLQVVLQLLQPGLGCHRRVAAGGAGRQPDELQQETRQTEAGEAAQVRRAGGWQQGTAMHAGMQGQRCDSAPASCGQSGGSAAGVWRWGGRPWRGGTRPAPAAGQGHSAVCAEAAGTAAARAPLLRPLQATLRNMTPQQLTSSAI